MPEEAASRRRLAIDGPAASGKSAVGRAVAIGLGFPFIDTGLIYRAVTWLALDSHVNLDDSVALSDLAASAVITLGEDPASASSVTINGRDATPFLRGAAVERAVSAVSAVAGVRAHLIDLQRTLACPRSVMAGRDIGSVVLPDAEIKIYLDATVEERARRRARELQAQGATADHAQLVEQMSRRDELDSTRAVAPLRVPAGAVRLQTDDLSLADVIARVLRLARDRWPDLAPRPCDGGAWPR